MIQMVTKEARFGLVSRNIPFQGGRNSGVRADLGRNLWGMWPLLTKQARGGVVWKAGHREASGASARVLKPCTEREVSRGDRELWGGYLVGAADNRLAQNLDEELSPGLCCGWGCGASEEALAKTTHFLTFHSKVIRMGI